MEYRYCGKSGLKLPEISLGLWHNFGETTPIERQRQIILEAFDKGITHFDLANNYGPPAGSAETNFGRIFRESLSTHRDEIIVTSKAGHLMWDGPYGDGSSRKYIMASIDQSLRRTGLEYFDIFYSHRHTPDTPLEETVQALIDIVRQGKALYIGLSKYPAEVAQQACEMMRQQHVRCLVYQDRYSMLDRRIEPSRIEFVKSLQIGMVAFSPLAQGLLTDRYLNGIPEDSRAKQNQFLKEETITPELVEKLRELNQFAHSRGQSLAQLALSWLLAKPFITSVIVGASSVEQLRNNLGAMNAPTLTDEYLKKIDQILGNSIIRS